MAERVPLPQGYGGGGVRAMVAESICEFGWGLVMGWESEGAGRERERRRRRRAGREGEIVLSNSSE